MSSNESEDETVTIDFPSAKLGSVTRKRREVELKLDDGGFERDEITTLTEALSKRIEKFESAVNEEKTKKCHRRGNGFIQEMVQ